MNRLVSGVRILMVGLPLKGYLPISTSKMLRTGRVLYTSDDVAKAVRLRSKRRLTTTAGCVLWIQAAADFLEPTPTWPG